jgi:hypothetical protein
MLAIFDALVRHVPRLRQRYHRDPFLPNILNRALSILQREFGQQESYSRHPPLVDHHAVDLHQTGTCF